MKEFVPAYLKPTWKLYDRTEKQGITNNCNLPFKVVSIDHDGNCMLCTCDGWLPISVCNIMDIDSFDKIWQTPRAIALQQDVSSKKFTYCSVDSCNIKKQDVVFENYYINLNYDESCNLACPTCRPKAINITSGAQYEQKLKMSKHISKLISKFDQVCTINMSGNGDPFASLIYRKFLMTVNPNPKHRYRLLTNGLLLKKLLSKTKIYNNIDVIDISIDAGDQQTYERVRKGGSWSALMENLDYLKSLDLDVLIRLNMVVQVENFHSIKHFDKLLQKYNWNGRISRLEDWSTFNKKQWQWRNISDKSHPLHGNLEQQIKNITNEKIFIGAGVL